jgi:TonB-linked SusC/RagA family outer membrane protein
MKKFIQLSLLIISFFWTCTNPLQAQENQISGQVIDASGQGLPGVNIIYKGTFIGTITDIYGNFALPVSENNDVLKVSFIGFKTQEINIGKDSFFKIVLEEDTQLLNELIVVGYGVQRKADLTGSVSSVDMSEFVKASVAGLDQALQGKAAGVTVSQNTGAPGEGVAVRIRGVGSVNSGNSPLYIVDGIPTTDALNSISPNDIESISVLKDAASAAIYGCRANNGVVLVTTKKGKSGKAKIQFNAKYGVQVHGELPGMTNRDEYVEMYNESATTDNEGIEDELLLRDLIDSDYASTLPDIDHLSEIFRTGTLLDYSLSVSGGNDKTQYLLSGSYFKQEGIVLNSDYDRYTGKMSFTSQANDWLKIGSNLNVSYSENNIIGSSGDGSGGNGGSVVRYALFRCSAIPTYDEDGEYVDKPDDTDYFGDGYNPVGLAMNTYNLKEINRAFGDVYANIKFSNQLQFTSKFGYDHYSYHQRRFDKTWGDDDRINNPNTLTVSDGNFTSLTCSNVVDYAIDINENHHLSIMVGSEAIKEGEHDNATSEKDFSDQDLSMVYLGNGEGTVSASESEWNYTLLSFFARANYNYADKYLVSATIREDGSSKFAVGHRWGTFYSTSAGWRIDKEEFMKDVSFLNQWKLRLGAGFIGNQDIGCYAYTDQIETGYNYSFGGVSQDGYAVTTFGNQDLEWETAIQYDGGMDIGLYDGKLNLSFDYFYKTTSNMLTEQSIPSSGGELDGGWVNDGKVLNQGFEFEVSYRNQINDFHYNISGIFSTTKNKVKSLSSPIYAGTIDTGIYATKTEKGYPVGSFYLYEMEGIFQTESEIITHAYQGDDIEPGDVKYKDQDGDGTIDSDDRKHVGSPIPKFTLGLNLGAEYKNFDCSMFFYGAFKQEIYYQVATDIEGFYRAFNLTKRYYDERWTGEGTSNTQPRASWDAESNNCKASTRFLEDGSYMRLKNIQLGYNFPQKITSRLHIDKCRIYFSGQNLWTLTDYPGLDPEMTTSDNSDEGDLAGGIDWGTYPSAKSYNFGIQITF